MSDLNKPLVNPVITGRPDLQPVSRRQTKQIQPANSSFNALFRKTLRQTQVQSVVFSRHAQSRTQLRGIELNDSDIEQLNNAVLKAEEKGLTDTLVFMNQTAFIVNVPSRVVVTVVDSGDNDNNVFTNIDGAVII